MKKTALFFVGLLAIVFWTNSHRNELAVWLNSNSFYKPIYSSKFDTLHPGSTVRAELTPSYDVKHGFFLVFPCENLPLDFFANLDGTIRYTILANGVELESKTMQPPTHPMGGLKNGNCDIALFTFDLPFKGHKKITLEVVLESPITKLAQYKNIRCEVSPAYWPK